MPIEQSIARVKIHGFGAFQQTAEFSLWRNRRLLAECRCPARKDVETFLDMMQSMGQLFEFAYQNDGELPDTLATEQEAWSLLRPHVEHWMQDCAAVLAKTPDDLVTWQSTIEQAAASCRSGTPSPPPII